MRINAKMTTGLIAAAALTSLGAQAASNVHAKRIEAPAAVAAATAQDTVEFSVYLPLRHKEQLDALLAQLHDEHSPQYHQWLQPTEFMQRFGPSPAELATVRRVLVAQGLTIVSSNAHGVRVRGNAAAVSQALGAPLQKRTERGHTRFQARQHPRVPSDLAAIDLRIVGLDALPERHVHARVLGMVPNANVDNRYGATGPYWFDDLKQAYDYPAYSAKTDGSGVSVAVLMADLIFPDDVGAAFTHEKFTALTGKPAPGVSTVLIDGGGVQDGYGSFEASLDVQQVLGGAPGADVTLVSIPDLSDQSIMDGYTYIIDSNQYDIVNSSFGGCELAYTAAYNDGTDYTSLLQMQHELFQQGNAQGITFVASSGDEGALECPSVDYFYGGTSPTFVAGVSTPAADPAVTAVGGGNLVTAAVSGSLNSAYVRESAFADPEAPYDVYGLGVNVAGGVWGAGGGVSSVFKRPPYQWLAKTGSGYRTVPDVGMQVGGCPGLATSCDPDDSAVVTAYGVGIGGGYYGVIGTSVSSPEFAGALALFEQQLGKKRHRLGNVNYYLYAMGALQTLAKGDDREPSHVQFYHRGMPGFDGLYNGDFPSYNYNYIYGNGTPDVRKLFGMTRYPAAGLPQTPTNP